MIKLYHLDPDKDWLGGARNGAKVMIALRDLELAHEVVFIDRRRDMRNPESRFCREVNPWGTVPVLDHDGFILRESASILRYLADLCPGTSIMPADLRQRALVDQWLTWECAMLVPSILTIVRLGRYDGVSDGTDPISSAQSLYQQKRGVPGMVEAEDRWRQNLRLLDDQLSEREYVAGEYSLADIALGCSAPIGPLVGLDLAPYPNVVAWLNRLSRRPHWQQERTFVLDMYSGKKAGLWPCSEAERAQVPVRVWPSP